MMKSILPSVVFLLLSAAGTRAAETLWNFSNSGNPLAAASGPGTLEYHDPNASQWGPASTQFGKASSFGLPALPGGDADVMSFPACAQDQGYLMTHAGVPNGVYGETDSLVSNYTLIMDVLYPASSDGAWRGLLQSDPNNSNDGEFFVQNAAGGGIGINSNYLGKVTPGVWHRIAFVVRAAAGEGQAHRFIDGQFVGAIGTTNSGLDLRWALQAQALLLTDNDNETRPGFASSIFFADRAMSMTEIAALGGPHAGGALTPGAAAPAYAAKMPRRVGAIGHRGGSFGSAPDNTLPALRQAFLDGAAGVEIDTRLTADGVCVCFHDATVDRTTEGFGNVADMTLAELKLLDAGSWYGAAFAGEKVPTLAEALTEAKGKGIVYLDIKTQGQAASFATAIAQTNFPVNDLWFWTPDDAAYAAEIRAAVPGAKILWGGPANTWATDANYFPDLRNLGVFGFSYSTDEPDPAFVARAKKEGFIVEVFTILDPEAMISAAAGGVDYIETDFPATMRDLQPVQLAAASGPLPANGGSVLSSNTVLRWVVGLSSTAHRIHFGTVNPPPFLAQQSSDLFQTPTLTAGTTYYWRIDEVTPGGTVTGPVWSFTTPAAPVTDKRFEFTMNGNLSDAIGLGGLAAAGSAGDLITFETTDGVTVPHIGDAPAQFVRVPAFTSPADGLALTLTGIAASGGTSVNHYTLIYDVLMPGSLNWMPFFNASPNNANDSDFFVRADGAVGIGTLGYSPAGTFLPDQWHRVAFSANLVSGEVVIYVDGVEVRRRTGAALTDGRFSFYPGSAAPPHVMLFGDENAETHEVLVNSVAFVDRPLTAAEIGALGAPKAAGIFVTAASPVNFTFGRTGSSVTFNWTAAPNRRLQWSSSLLGGTWTDVGGTLGLGTHTETANQPRRFYRVAE